MDPVRNPYGPGEGTPPPELSGRSHILRDAEIALQRKKAGRPNKSQILVGLRGVGKTVLLNLIDGKARALGYRTAAIEVSEDKSVAQMLIPAMRVILFDLDRARKLSEKVKRAFRVMRSFIGNVYVRMGELEFGLGVDPEVGIADSGDLDADLAAFLTAVAEAAADRKTSIAIVVDELQYLKESEFAALIMAIHRVTQLNLPVTLVGAGLPSVRSLAGRAKSYAERLFEFPAVGPLSDTETREAIQVPAKREGAAFATEALNRIERITKGYPYFVQEWAYQAWNVAAKSPVRLDDVNAATTIAIRRLDESFFRVRFDRLTNTEKKYLRAMAELGPGPHRSSDVAEAYGAALTSVAPVRGSLISKGMIYSPAHGDAAFTVPLFDEFMRRTMTYQKPRSSDSSKRRPTTLQ